MPIRINLLAEQQAAEEARRKDPIKLSLIGGGTLITLALCWILYLYVQVKGQRNQLVRLTEEFNRVDKKAQVVREIQGETGDIEKRLRTLEKYSTNRVLWAPMLDSLQRATFDNVRFKRLTVKQAYSIVLPRPATDPGPPFPFFTTNVNVAVKPPPAAWKFWAGLQPPTDVYTPSSNVIKLITNAPPFSTNFLPYITKMAVTFTNLPGTEVRVTCDFHLPAFCTEEINVTIEAGDYGVPPGSTIGQIEQTLTNMTYFSSRITSGPERAKITDLPRPFPDPTVPGAPMHQPFTLRMKYADRILINE